MFPEGEDEGGGGVVVGADPLLKKERKFDYNLENEGTKVQTLGKYRLRHTVRPCFMFRRKGIATSANRSPYMYSCATLWAYLSQGASTASFHWEQLTVH